MIRNRLLVCLALLASACGDVKAGADAGTGGSGGGSGGSGGTDAPVMTDAPNEGDAGPTFTLTVNTSGAGMGAITGPGGINCGTGATACSGAFPAGTVVTLTANPGSTSVLGTWSGDCSGTGTTCTLTMNADHAAGAAFLRTFSLTVTPTMASGCTSSFPTGTVTTTPPGISCQTSGGTVSGTCTARFTEGTSVQITATQGAQTAVDCISGACSAGSCTQNQSTSSISCSTTMDADKVASAVFCGLMF